MVKQSELAMRHPFEIPKINKHCIHGIVKISTNNDVLNGYVEFDMLKLFNPSLSGCHHKGKRDMLFWNGLT